MALDAAWVTAHSRDMAKNPAGKAREISQNSIVDGIEHIRGTIHIGQD